MLVLPVYFRAFLCLCVDDGWERSVVRQHKVAAKGECSGDPKRRMWMLQMTQGAVPRPCCYEWNFHIDMIYGCYEQNLHVDI